MKLSDISMEKWYSKFDYKTNKTQKGSASFLQIDSLM